MSHPHENERCYPLDATSDLDCAKLGTAGKPNAEMKMRQKYLWTALASPGLNGPTGSMPVATMVLPVMFPVLVDVFANIVPVLPVVACRYLA